MEDSTSKIPLFKKIDKSVFTALDKFKLTPNYNTIQDFYNGLEEEQQKIFKAIVILLIFVLPMTFLSFFFFFYNQLKNDLDLSVLMVNKANAIISQNQVL